MPPPTAEQRRAIASQIQAGLRRRMGELGEPTLSDAVLASLATLTPRRIARVLELALPHVLSQGRERIAPADIAAALALLDGWLGRTGARRIGFVPARDAEA